MRQGHYYFWLAYIYQVDKGNVNCTKKSAMILHGELYPRTIHFNEKIIRPTHTISLYRILIHADLKASCVTRR